MADDPKPETPDLGKLVEAALAKHGDQTSALKAFASDLYSARDDAKAWGAYQGLGKPSDLRKVIEEHQAFGQKVSGYERDETLRGVAEKAGVKFPVLKTLAGSLAFEEKPVKGKDGKDVSVVHVKEGDAAPVPFDDYAAAHWSDFLPALRPAEAKVAEAKRPPGTPTRHETAFRPEPEPLKADPLRTKLQMIGAGSF